MSLETLGELCCGETSARSYRTPRFCPQGPSPRCPRAVTLVLFSKLRRNSTCSTRRSPDSTRPSWGRCLFFTWWLARSRSPATQRSTTVAARAKSHDMRLRFARLDAEGFNASNCGGSIRMPGAGRELPTLRHQTDEHR